MSLSWGFKVTWFALSLLGLLQTFVTMLWIGRNILSRWIRMTYLSGVVVLEVAFCLGMIWKLDPYIFPRWFCIVQSLAWCLGAGILTGVAASFTLASSFAVLRPVAYKAATQSSIFAWHPRYIALVVAFPVLAFVLLATLTFVYDSAQPIPNGMQCDSQYPIWMLLMGYAGPPQLLTIPFLCLSICSAYRLQSVRNRMLCSHFSTSEVISSNDPEHHISFGDRMSNRLKRFSRVNSMATMSGGPSSPLECPPYPHDGFKAKVLQLTGMQSLPRHLDPSGSDAVSLSDSKRELKHAQLDLSMNGGTRSRPDSYDSRVDSLMPTFAPNPSIEQLKQSSTADRARPTSADDSILTTLESKTRSVIASASAATNQYGPLSPHSAQSPLHPSTSRPALEPLTIHGRTASLTKDAHSMRASSLQEDANEGNDNDDEESIVMDWRQAISQPPTESMKMDASLQLPDNAILSSRQAPLNRQLREALWRMILFQIVFFGLELLTGLSPLISVTTGVRHPFGTQQIALVLAAWAPIVVFGHTKPMKNTARALWVRWKHFLRRS